MEMKITSSLTGGYGYRGLSLKQGTGNRGMGMGMEMENGERGTGNL